MCRGLVRSIRLSEGVTSFCLAACSGNDPFRLCEAAVLVFMFDIDVPLIDPETQVCVLSMPDTPVDFDALLS